MKVRGNPRRETRVLCRDAASLIGLQARLLLPDSGSQERTQRRTHAHTHRDPLLLLLL